MLPLPADRRLAGPFCCCRKALSRAAAATADFRAGEHVWQWVFAALVLGVFVVGCAPQKVVSPQATELPLLDQDPRENGENLGRWPCFRGPQCQGIAPGGNPPVRFGPKQNLRWKTPVPGRGNSSPVVWDDHVVLTSALDQFDPPQLVVLCFDRWSGRQRSLERPTTLAGPRR